MNKAQLAWPAGLPVLLCSLGLFGALCFGGGTRQGLVSDAIAIAVAIPLLGYVWADRWRGLSGLGPRILLVSLALGAGWALVQLIPLPPGVWTLLPGRAALAAPFELAGHDVPWLPLALNPPGVLLSLLALVPAVAIFCGMPWLSSLVRQRLVVGVIGVGVISVFVGLLQLADGSPEPLGLFANRNHFAALLYVSLTLAVVQMRLIMGDGWRRLGAMAFGLAIIIVLVLGIGLARSRAGLIVAIIGVLGALAIPLSQQSAKPGSRKALWVIAAVVVLAALLAAEYGLWGLLKPLDVGSLADRRARFVGVSLEAAARFFPFGTGLGSFVAVFGWQDTASGISDVYANHAHNDWVELLLELGLPGLLAMIVFVGWFAVVSYGLLGADRSWRTNDLVMARSGLLVVGLLMLHSLVDYPLRTIALLTLWTFAMGLTVPPIAAAAEMEDGEHALDGRRVRRASPP